MRTYTITMTHTVETIRRLSKVQYNTFHKKAKFFWYTLFFCCILGGLDVFGQVDSTVQILLIAIGGIGITNVGASASARANQVLRMIKASGNQFPESEMTITPKKITVLERGSDQPNQVKKSDVYRLVEDKNYVYIFITREAAYMLPKDQIDDFSKFKEVLASATDHTIHVPLQPRDAALLWLLKRWKK